MPPNKMLATEVQTDMGKKAYTPKRIQMKHMHLFLILIFATTTVFAEIPTTVVEVVENYADNISCNNDSNFGYQPVQLDSTKAEDGQDFEKYYAVAWHGDIGCYGGNSSVSANIAIVKVTNYLSKVIVVPNVDTPDLESRFFDSIEFINGKIRITGKRYGEDDPVCCPSIETMDFLTFDPRNESLSSTSGS